MRTLLGYTGSLIGGLSLFLCTYWFFHFETWTERGVYIGLTLFIIYILIKLVPKNIVKTKPFAGEPCQPSTSTYL